MKMFFSKCRLFIIFLTFCYIFDSVFAENNKELFMGVPRITLNPLIEKLKSYGFNGKMEHDQENAKKKIAEYNTKKEEISGNPSLAADDLQLVSIEEYNKFLNEYNGYSSNYMWPYSFHVYQLSKKINKD